MADPFARTDGNERTGYLPVARVATVASLARKRVRCRRAGVSARFSPGPLAAAR
jgi:hypothetical protein